MNASPLRTDNWRLDKPQKSRTQTVQEKKVGNWFVADLPNNTGQFFDPVSRLSNVSHVRFCTMNAVFFFAFWENWYKRRKKMKLEKNDLHKYVPDGRWTDLVHTQKGCFFFGLIRLLHSNPLDQLDSSLWWCWGFYIQHLIFWSL